MLLNGEELIAQRLRKILDDALDGARIAEAENFREILSTLERFVPQVLGETYPEWGEIVPKWKSESLDGIYPVIARKVWPGEAEIFGLCVLLSDQTLVPLHLRLQISPSADEISWFECRLGERGAHGMTRTEYSEHALNKLTKQLYQLEGKADSINWVYKATYGERRG